MPEFGFQGISHGSAVEISVSQDAKSATNSVAAWRQSLADFKILSRDSGELISPAGIVFEVSNFSDFPMDTTPDPVTTYNPAFHEVSWVWDFGDSANAAPTTHLNVPDAWKDLNTAFGPKAFHVFNDPGTYTVTCNAYHRGALLASATKKITFEDADNVFSGTRTLVVSQTGNFRGKPSGAAEFNNLSAALAAYRSMPSPGRLLLRAGEVFSGLSQSIDSSYSNFRLGSFGAGEKPVLRVRNPAFDEGEAVGLNFLGTAPRGPVIHDIRFEGGWDTNYEVGRNRQVPFNMGYYETSNWFASLHRCEFSGFESLPATPFFDRGDAFTFALNDTLVTNWRNYGLFAQPSPGPGLICVVGSALRQSPGAMRGSASYGSKTGLGNDHGPYRNAEAVESIFSVLETFSNTAWSGVQPQGGLRSGSNGGKNYQVVIDRFCNEGGPAFGSGAVANKSQELAGNAILDKILAIGVAPYDKPFNIACGGTTVRNALFYFPDVPYFKGFGGSSQVFHSERRGSNPDNLTAPIRIHNVTALSLADDVLNYSFAGSFDAFEDLAIENYIFHAPHQPSTQIVDTPVDITTAIPGVTPQYQGLRNSVGKPSVELVSTVAGSGGTQLFAYPDGFEQSDFNVSTPRHLIKVGNWYFYAEDGDISLAFEASGIIVTNLSGQNWAAGMVCLLGLEITPSAYAAQLDDSYANPGTVPTCAPLPGSAAKGSAVGEFIARDDLLMALRDDPPSRGAVRSS